MRSRLAFFLPLVFLAAVKLSVLSPAATAYVDQIEGLLDEHAAHVPRRGRARRRTRGLDLGVRWPSAATRRRRPRRLHQK